VATRKVRAKRFVECFMKSFRIVDFLCLPRSRLTEFMARPMYARAERARVHAPRERAHCRKYKRILFKFLKSPAFCAFCASDSPAGALSERATAPLPPPSSRGRRRWQAASGARFSSSHNRRQKHFGSVDQCGARGCKGRMAAAARQVAIGFQLENDYSCRVTVAATWARLSPRIRFLSSSRAVTRRRARERDKDLFSLSLSLSLSLPPSSSSS